MSANNQMLIKKYKGKWHLFPFVMSESWGKTNRIPLRKSAFSSYDVNDVIDKAIELDEAEDYPSEYGICFDVLAKDGVKVTIIP